MRRLLLLILALALLPISAQAYDVLILQSTRNAAYDEVLKGFRIGSNPSERVIVLSDYAEVDVIRIVREDRPKVILAVGDTALASARKVQGTPVVAVMSLGIHTLKTPQPNLTGIGMFAPPDRYIRMFTSLGIRRIGVIHNPAKSGWYLQRARKEAEAAGIALVTRTVTEPRQAIEQLAALAGKVDALWMLPDSTAVTRETTEAYFRFGQHHSVPVISFAASYLGLGAAAVVDIDRVALGEQAADLAASILKGSSIGANSPAFPRRVALKTNSQVLKQLNLLLSEL